MFCLTALLSTGEGSGVHSPRICDFYQNVLEWRDLSLEELQLSSLEKRNWEVPTAALQILQVGYQEDGVTAQQCTVRQQDQWVKTDTRKAPRDCREKTFFPVKQ